MERSKKFVKRIFKQRRVAMLTLFILCSSVLWFLIKFSETYSGVVSLKVVYENVPEDKILLGKPVDRLNFNINARGFQILNYRLFNHELKLDASKTLRHLNKEYLSKAYLDQAAEQYFPNNIRFEQINKDTIFLDFGINKRKIISIEEQLELNFKADYELSDSLIISPSTITVLGPEDAVDTIKHFYTEKITLNNIDDDIDINAKLIIPDGLKALKLSTNQVLIKGQVARFSERLIKVPVIIANAPPGSVVRVFPKEVTIICRATLEAFKEINDNDFKVICDFNELTDTSNYLIPKIHQQPKNIKQADLVEKKVEYLIEKE